MSKITDGGLIRSGTEYIMATLGVKWLKLVHVQWLLIGDLWRLVQWWQDDKMRGEGGG